MQSTTDHRFPVDVSAYNMMSRIDNARFKIINFTYGTFKTSFKRHMHSFYELHCVTGGKGILITDDGEYPLEENCIFLTTPRQNHIQLTDPDYPMEEYCLSFETELSGDVDKMITDFTKLNFWIGVDRYNVKNCLQEIVKEFTLQHRGWALAAELLFSQIILAVIRSAVPEYSNTLVSSTPDSRRNLIIDEAFLYSYKTLSLAALSQRLCLSQRQVQRILKDKYGIGFTELLNRAKINAATDMLINCPHLCIREISEKTGFGDVANFSKRFKAVLGLSPTQYRKENQTIQK